MVEPQANEAYVDTKVAASVALEAKRAQTAEKSLSDRIDTKQAALDASQVTTLNSGINAQRVFDIVSLAGSDSNSGKSVRTIVGEEMMKLVDGAPDTYDTLKEIADWIAKDETGTQAIVNQVKGLTEEVTKKADATAVANLLKGKVDKVDGKGLSTKDYTAAEQDKLAGIEAGAQKNPDLTPYAKKEDVPYALIEVPLEDSINLTNRAINKVTADDSLSSITFIFPEKKEGVSRDFFLRLVITGETLPTLSFVEPNGDAVSFDVDDDSWADIEQGVNILMFTDTAE